METRRSNYYLIRDQRSLIHKTIFPEIKDQLDKDYPSFFLIPLAINQRANSASFSLGREKQRAHPLSFSPFRAHSLFFSDWCNQEELCPPQPRQVPSRDSQQLLCKDQRTILGQSKQPNRGLHDQLTGADNDSCAVAFQTRRRPFPLTSDLSSVRQREDHGH